MSNSKPSATSVKPWVQGPKELLEHGCDLIDQNQASRWRIAFAVEIMIKTYLTLPKRITHISLSRAKLSERIGSFPKLLDLLQEVAPKKLMGLDINELDWFHRVRNDLYHNGHGLLIEQKLVILYSEVAKQLFFNLFQIQITTHSKEEEVKRLGQWIQTWTHIDSLISKQIGSLQVHMTDRSSTTSSLSLPEKIVLYASSDHKQIDAQLQSLYSLRQAIVTGEVDFREVLTEEQLQQIDSIRQSLIRDA